MLENRKIILGITGSIAAYKAVYLARTLIKRGAEVQVVITPSGKEFITPVTLSSLTQKPVISEFFTANTGEWHSHVDLGLWADAMLVAPATASTIAKMANGIADNMLVTTYLSARSPVFVAPAMDFDMYRHPTTRRNLDLLRSYGNHIIEPAEGALASGLEGKGRMEEPEKIADILDRFFDESGSFAGKRVMVTAGPTYEKIDPVRFIGNYSSGKMGYAIAAAFAARGADVTLVSGPVTLPAPAGVKRVDVESAREMYNVATACFPDTDIAVMCAAVADFAPAQTAVSKIKRGTDGMTLQLVPNPDIAAALGKMKKPGQILAGFALESDNEEANARYKLEKKNLDFIVLNSLADKGACLGGDNNKVTVISRSGDIKACPMKSKGEVAEDIVTYISEMFLK